jgi:hypothetical protein
VDLKSNRLSGGEDSGGCILVVDAAELAEGRVVVGTEEESKLPVPSFLPGGERPVSALIVLPRPLFVSVALVRREHL